MNSTPRQAWLFLPGQPDWAVLCAAERNRRTSGPRATAPDGPRTRRGTAPRDAPALANVPGGPARSAHQSSATPFARRKMSPIKRSTSAFAVDQHPQATGSSPPDCTKTARSESSSGKSDGPRTCAPPINARATLRSMVPSRRTRRRRVVTTSCLGTPTTPVGLVLPFSPGCSHHSSGEASFRRSLPEHVRGRDHAPGICRRRSRSNPFPH